MVHNLLGPRPPPPSSLLMFACRPPHALQQVDGHELDAIESGLAMQDAIQAAHAEWAAVGLPILKFRAGIHSGPCLVGNFGCSHRVAYTCLGDTVNLASRLEALNKKFGTYLMCSDNTYQKVSEGLRRESLERGGNPPSLSTLRPCLDPKGIGIP